MTFCKKTILEILQSFVMFLSLSRLLCSAKAEPSTAFVRWDSINQIENRSEGSQCRNEGKQANLDTLWRFKWHSCEMKRVKISSRKNFQAMKASQTWSVKNMRLSAKSRDESKSAKSMKFNEMEKDEERCMKRWILCMIRFWEFWDLIGINLLWNLPMFWNLHWLQTWERKIRTWCNRISWMIDLIWFDLNDSSCKSPIFG
jgi:hypothetical protein